jgi:hypothetical protein
MSLHDLRSVLQQDPIIQQLGVVFPNSSFDSDAKYLQIIQSILRMFLYMNLLAFSQAFVLDEQDKKINVLHSNLARLQDYSRATCDVVFEVGDQSVYAHSEIGLFR